MCEGNSGQSEQYQASLYADGVQMPGLFTHTVYSASTREICNTHQGIQNKTYRFLPYVSNFMHII